MVNTGAYLMVSEDTASTGSASDWTVVPPPEDVFTAILEPQLVYNTHYYTGTVVQSTTL